MSIPERFYRIARHKLSEIKDRIDQWDEEAKADPAEQERRRKAAARVNAKHELEDAMGDPGVPSRQPSADSGPAPLKPEPRLRTPEQIAGGHRGTDFRGQTGGAASTQSANQPDPLEYHYRLMGVEPGMEFSTVQAAYNKLTARADPGRFPAGSNEAREAQAIRDRAETSYRILRDALDPTSRRFDLIELDDRPADDSAPRRA